MPLFDFYVMVDWSGAARRRGMRADSIWIAFGSVEDESPKTLSPFSRSEATHFVRELLHAQLRDGHRVLLCFDLAYGFPRDFAAALQAATGGADHILPWLAIWEFLRSEINDDEGTTSDRKPSNRSNRFEVASKINSLLSESADTCGPFWCASSETAYQYLPQTRPQQPFHSAQGFLIQPLRFTDLRARSGTPFRLYGTASVGSQTLTGIPRLHELRFAPEFAQRSVIWPFETGWATKAGWLRQGVSIVHAEIYPSLREPLPDAIKDRGQVRSMWECACELDRQDLLWFEFARPVEIDPGSPEDLAVQLTEGWILGSSPTVRHQ
jgi:precorrin-8X/cobalt-precorrin-8 methylmutase